MTMNNFTKMIRRPKKGNEAFTFLQNSVTIRDKFIGLDCEHEMDKQIIDSIKHLLRTPFFPCVIVPLTEKNPGMQYIVNMVCPWVEHMVYEPESLRKKILITQKQKKYEPRKNQFLSLLEKVKTSAQQNHNESTTDIAAASVTLLEDEEFANFASCLYASSIYFRKATNIFFRKLIKIFRKTKTSETGSITDVVDALSGDFNSDDEEESNIE